MTDTFYTPQKSFQSSGLNNSSSRTSLNNAGRVTKSYNSNNRQYSYNNYDSKSSYNAAAAAAAVASSSNNLINGLNINGFGFGMSLEQQLILKMNTNLERVMRNKNTTQSIASKAPLELASDHLSALMEYDNTTPELNKFTDYKATQYNFCW